MFDVVLCDMFYVRKWSLPIKFKFKWMVNSMTNNAVIKTGMDIFLIEDTM